MDFTNKENYSQKPPSQLSGNTFTDLDDSFNGNQFVQKAQNLLEPQSRYNESLLSNPAVINQAHHSEMPMQMNPDGTLSGDHK